MLNVLESYLKENLYFSKQHVVSFMLCMNTYMLKCKKIQIRKHFLHIKMNTFTFKIRAKKKPLKYISDCFGLLWDKIPVSLVN